MTTPHPTPLAQSLSAIAALDLRPIKFKATRQEDGYGWSADHADRMELAYKRYLMLHAKYPGVTLAPDQDVDRFWHLHILDTRKYAADCEAVFGYFLHHFPYLGLRGGDDAQVLQAAFETTQALYAQEFGADDAGDARAAWCGADGEHKRHAAWCGADTEQKAQAAWCGADAAQPAHAAWCGAEQGVKAAAWCGADGPATREAAWCGIEQRQTG
ncbi:MAG: hypothetical protein KF891_09700 [Rhizobacter sp.]|nr:hypothetical protein [Rhizobacter sp.]